MAELFVVNGICGGTVYFLPDVPTVVGRSAECHVQIADPWISSMHALFERRGGDLWVVDLDSRNGTFVDGERIHEASVRAGMRLRFGKTEAELRAGGEVAEPRSIIQGESTVIRYLSDLVGRQETPAAPARSGAVAPMPRRGPSDITISARRQIQVINEIGRISTANTSLDETLRLILRTLAASVGAEAASVLLLDERGEMVPHAVEPPGAEPRVSATVVQAALRARAGILTFDAQQDQRFSQSQSVISQGIRSCMCAPIWAENRILGALLLDRSYTEPFTAEDLELATLVGFQAAMAVDRARLADRTRAADEQRQRLLRHLPPGATAALVGSEAPERDLLAPGLRSEAAVLAVTLVDLAALVQARPPEEVAARVLAVQETVRAMLLEEGAAVDVRMTGGVVAVFGLLHADPQAGERALRCAVAVREKVASLEAGRAEPRIALGAGVEAGTVLSGNFGEAERPELRAVGAAVEAALRLAAGAERGQVMAGPVVATRSGAGLEFGAPSADGARRVLGG